MVRPFDTNKNTITVDPHITTSDYTTVRNLVEPARGTSLPRKQARKADKHIMLAALVPNTERPKKLFRIQWMWRYQETTITAHFNAG